MGSFKYTSPAAMVNENESQFLVRVLFLSITISSGKKNLLYSQQGKYFSNFLQTSDMLKRPQHTVDHAKFKTTVSRPFPQQHGISSANIL